MELGLRPKSFLSPRDAKPNLVDDRQSTFVDSMCCDVQGMQELLSESLSPVLYFR